MEAYDTNDVLLARKSETIKVTAGETAECSIALKIFASSILESNYILWNYRELKKYFKSFSSISENTEVENSQFYSSHQYVSLAETASAQYVMKMDIDTSSSYYSYSITNLSNNSSSSIKTDNVTLFYDCLYYDDTTDSLWVGAYDSSSRKQLYFARINGAPDSTNETTLQSSNFIIDSTKGSDTSTFAVQGSTLYFAYKSYDNGTCYLQRASITENADGTFAVSKVGSAKSVSDLGVSGAITDIAILYDGTVYVLVSNVGNSSGDSGDLFNYYYDKSNTMYSRGALLKIQSTSSGFEVVDTLGWTGSSRQIAPVGEAKDESTLTTLQPLTAYIPSLSEKSNKFYGPRRFVAIKPKEIAIADCGANFVMPNCNKKLYGKRFDHNRVVTVSLSSFAINVVTELRNIKFSDLTLGGSGTSGGYIYAKDCKYKDTDNNEIEEQ
ncbi:hypothetical protein [Treponema succinifaciens]|uniref:hypothetical protein n=1 Tax=Treponema succinifaciens TaxID=167 RepID=UPI0023F36CFE|nr:hypothetical protein [Treponema succinifaciens]